MPPCLFRDYDAVDESDILNICTYSLVKNKKMSWVIKQVFVASLGFSGSLEIKCVALISEWYNPMTTFTDSNPITLVFVHLTLV